MPLLFYLPYIIAMGMLQVAAESFAPPPPRDEEPEEADELSIAPALKKAA